MEHHFAVLRNDGRAAVISVPLGDNPNAVAEGYNVLEDYSTPEAAEERCEIENDPAKRELFVYGELKVRGSTTN
jgi:hypothetical protein